MRADYKLEVMDTVSSCFAVSNIWVRMPAAIGSFINSKLRTSWPLLSTSMVHCEQGRSPRCQFCLRLYFWSTSKSASQVRQLADCG